jgi:hypothetical protein
MKPSAAWFCASLCVAALAGAGSATAAVYRVGPDQAYRTIASVPKLKPGDVVEIEPGTYREFRKWTESGTPGRPITLRGVGSARPVIDGTGLSVTGAGSVPRALFQIQGDHYVVENLEFRNATNGENGAGIRITGATDTTIRRCKIARCDMGMMSDGNDRLLIERCEIAENGNPTGFNGYSHNLYLGGNRTTVRFCWIHDAICGMNFKSRGRYVELLYNRIEDSNEGEVSLVDGEETKEPGSHAVLIGNVIVSKPDRTGNHAKFIDWGQDMGGARNGTLFLLNNTLVAGSSQIVFLASSAPGASVTASNNVFYGSDQVVGTNRGGVSGANNWLPRSAAVPNGFEKSLRGADPGFVDARRGDFRLTAASPCRGAGQPHPAYKDDSNTSRDGAPRFQTAAPLQVAPRRDAARPDLGALAFLRAPTGRSMATDHAAPTDK